jgi:hypothetical protein
MATKTTRQTTKKAATTAPKGRKAAPTPEPTPKPIQRRCLVPDCPRTEVRRGLCHPCAAEAGALVRAGLTSWEALEAEGKARPLGDDRPKGDLPHRKSWFLGHWTPKGGYLVVETPPTPEEVPV